MKMFRILKYHMPAVILFLGVIILNTRPMLLHIGDAVASHPSLYLKETKNCSDRFGIMKKRWDMDIGIASWVYAWDCHQLLHHPTKLFQANIYYPLPNSLALIDNYLGPALMGLPVHILWKRPALTYNIILLLAFSGTALSLYFYVLHRTGSFLAAWVTGFAAASLPYHYAHLHTIHKSMFMSFPLAFYFLEKWLDTRRFRYASALGTVFIFQVISTWYLTVCLGFLLGLRILWITVTQPRKISNKKVFYHVLLILPVVAAIVFLFARPYIENNRRFPSFQRDIHSLKCISPAAYITAPRDGWLYGSAAPHTLPLGAPLRSFFPGFTYILLASAGILAIFKHHRRNSGNRNLVIFLILIGLVSAGLSLGPFLSTSKGKIPFFFYYFFNLIPFMKALRGPEDFVLIVYFSMLIFMGFGVAYLLPEQKKKISFPLVIILSLLILFETIKQPQPLVELPWGPQVPACYHRAATLPEQSPVATFFALHRSDAQIVFRSLNHWAMYYSIFHFHPIPEGHSAYKPPIALKYASFTRHFPSRKSIRYLQARHIEYVLIDLQSISPDRRNEALMLIRAVPELACIDTYADSAVFRLSPHI